MIYVLDRSDHPATQDLLITSEEDEKYLSRYLIEVKSHYI